MSKKIREVEQRLAWNYERNRQIYEQVLAEVIDTTKIAQLLRELETNALRREHFQRQLDIEIERSKANWWDRLFG